MVLQRLGGGRALVSPWEEMGAMGSVGDILVMEAINQPLFICQRSKGQRKSRGSRERCSAIV